MSKYDFHATIVNSHSQLTLDAYFFTGGDRNKTLCA